MAARTSAGQMRERVMFLRRTSTSGDGAVQADQLTDPLQQAGFERLGAGNRAKPKQRQQGSGDGGAGEGVRRLGHGVINRGAAGL